MSRLIRSRSPLSGTFVAPASKPETQRAILLASLARGTSTIEHALVCDETRTMMEACRSLGTVIEHEDSTLRIAGVADALFNKKAQPTNRYVWAAGSALVGRIFLALGCCVRGNIVVDGNNVLRGRPFAPLFDALQARGVELKFFDKGERLPVAPMAKVLPGGTYRLATSVSSQFATALLVAAPFAREPLSLELVGPTYSLPYIDQTVDMMRRFGVDVQVSDDGRRFDVPLATHYDATDVATTGDYTSASYILGAAFSTRGKITVRNLDPESLQGERAILDILEGLGATISWIGHHTLELDCTDLPEEIDISFDLRHCPNILPTVAALAATIPGRVRLTGARLTQLHKSPRIEAMAEELGKVGITTRLIHDHDNEIDGLEVRGVARQRGGVAFSSHGDHRIFMSLVLLALASDLPCRFDSDEQTTTSFPGFVDLVAPKDPTEWRRANELELIPNAA